MAYPGHDAGPDFRQGYLPALVQTPKLPESSLCPLYISFAHQPIIRPDPITQEIDRAGTDRKYLRFAVKFQVQDVFEKARYFRQNAVEKSLVRMKYNKIIHIADIISNAQGLLDEVIQLIEIDVRP